MSGPAVSDHALVRFLERAGGIDVEAVRAAISSGLARAHHAARQMDSQDHLITVDGTVFVVRCGVVTTIMPEGDKGMKARALAPRGKMSADRHGRR